MVWRKQSVTRERRFARGRWGAASALRVMEETRGIPDVVDAVNHPTTALDDLMASEDAIEGVTAFAAKRRPQWRNR